jgi:hypothetical protein
MKKTRWLLLLSGLIVALVINSCKKSGQSPIASLFTGGYWQLASAQVTYFTGNSADSTVTLDSACTLKQVFTFNTNNTCTYTNFDCIQQTPAVAQWSLSSNQLYLMANVVCKDTSAAGSSMPFSNALIYNLGQFSLVLQTGDIQPNYSLTKKRKIVQYGFIRQKLNGSD